VTRETALRLWIYYRTYAVLTKDAHKGLIAKRHASCLQEHYRIDLDDLVLVPPLTPQVMSRIK